MTLDKTGVTFFLFVTCIFGVTTAIAPQIRYSPEDMPGMVVSLPVVFGTMMVGPLFYWLGARLQQRARQHPCMCYSVSPDSKCPYCGKKCHCDGGLRILVEPKVRR